MYHGSISSKVYIDHTLARIFFLRLEGTFRRRFPSSLHIYTLGVNFNDGIVERGLTQHRHRRSASNSIDSDTIIASAGIRPT